VPILFRHRRAARKIIGPVVSGGSRGGRRSGPVSQTGRFTGRRLGSALSSWRASLRGKDVLGAGILVALSLGVGGYLLIRARSAARVEFAESAQRLQSAIMEELKLPADDLETVGHFIQATGRVTRRQFALFAAPMLGRHRFVYALEWLPLVPASERPGLEAEARLEGLTGYRFWERGPNGHRREAGLRESYIPIHYMEPPNAVALGFDIEADPVRRAIAEKARDTGMPTASPPFGLIEDSAASGSPPAVALYRALYTGGDPASEAARRASLAGFVLAVFRVEPLVGHAVATVDASGLGFSLRDLDAGAAPPMAVRPGNAAALPRRPGFELKFPVQFQDRRWALDVFALPGTFLPVRRGAAEVAIVGILAALLALVVVTSLRTIARLRRQVEKVGPYRLVARLGQGAMGVVWEARHALLRRPTAVKLLAPGTEGERALARFEREVQLTAGLTHPSTIAIYDYGRTANGIFYYAMELLRGINLTQLVAFDGPLPPGRVVHLLRQACGALSEAHAAGLIHRDIKPANIMICLYGGMPDFLKLLDFGLVKDISAVERDQEAQAPGDSDAALSQDGSLLGTPLYMAPEGMSDPSGVDARADLFALGAVGYFLLTGRTPFPGQTALEVFALERQGSPPSLAAARYPVPPALGELIRRCLSFRREDRPESAEALDGLLEACAVTPPWTTADARAWWRDRGSAALEMARAQREERGQFLMLSSDQRVGS
jgi:CHASE1-domain containing sensor protein